MSNNQLQLRKIVIVAIIIIFALLISAIVLSILWPPSWNPLLGSLLLNIAASLIGVLVGVFVAIFFVERYLEHQRREKRKREHLLKVYWIYGGLSVLTAMIMHLSFFLLYGTRKWQALMITDSKQTKVPETIVDFIPWLMAKDTCRPAATKEKLTLFEKEFNKTPRSPIKITRRDLEILASYMESCATRIRDQFFLFQPFIHEHFEEVSSLVLFARSLDDAIQDSKSSLAVRTEEGKLPSSFHLDKKGQHLFQSLGKEAVKVSGLILADYATKGSEESQINP
jgi:hypothetical protein